MKLIKLTLCMAAFLAVSPVAMAVGPMEKSDIREGQLICLGNGAGLKDSHAVVNASRQDDRGASSDSTSAQ